MGGPEALSRLAAQLPINFPAAVCVVLHVNQSANSMLAPILDRAGPLPAVFAEDGMDLRPGRIHVSRPGRHLLVEGERLRLGSGPKENRHRPAVDALFRSAAVSRGPGVIGVLLTGLLDDGVAGLEAIRSCGGFAVVQDPEDARYPEMPRAAVNAGQVDVLLPLEGMGRELDRLVRAATREHARAEQGLIREVEIATSARGAATVEPVTTGDATPFVCMDCGGPLQEVEETRLLRYRCKVGHAFGLGTMLDAQQPAIEEALWVAIRTLESRAALFERLSDRAQSGRITSILGRYEAERDAVLAHAAELRRLLERIAERQQPLEPEGVRVTHER